jgi:ParB family chromosome partitioning protein
VRENPFPSADPRRRGLGRGLGALIPGADQPEQPAEISLSSLKPGTFQPRQSVDPRELAELVESVRRHGVLQPIVVRPAGDGYEVVAGERRWRAAEVAGLKTIPAVVRELDDRQAVEVALVENLQRQDLSPLERAHAYRRLVEEFGLTQEQVAERVGKSQPSVANTLRLLQLPAPVQASLQAGRISEGHARAILGAGTVPRMLDVWQKVERRGLSVRETEALVRSAISRGMPSRRRGQPAPHLRAVEQDLSRRYGTEVRVVGGPRRGRLVFAYRSEEDLQRLLDLLLD